MKTRQKSMREVEVVEAFRGPYTIPYTIHTIVEVETLPKCDICERELGVQTTAFYDARTKNGYWAYLCEDHFASEGIGLGLGKGQRLVLARRLQEESYET